MSFIRKHWLLLLALGLFFYGVYSFSQNLTKVATAALAFLLYWAGTVSLLFWLLPVYAAGFAFGFLPSGLYDWIPRSNSKLNATLIH